VGLVFSPLAAAVAVEARVCVFARVTGKPCPGCGMTRATVSLARGEVAEAMKLHPLSPVASPVLGGLLVLACVGYVVRGHTGIRPWVGWVVMAVSVAMLLVWAARLFGAFGGPVPV